MNNLVEQTKQLISIQSTEDNPDKRKEILHVVLSQLSRWTIERFEKNGYESVLIHNRNTRPDTFQIILNGHLDVVPNIVSRYVPEIEGNRLYGVGAWDMKASIACLISVFNEVADKVTYPLALQLVTDEEIGGLNGTKHQIESGVNGQFVIAAEPTNFGIVHKAKGILTLKITAKGVTAHGAYPWRGVNAISQMQLFLATLEAHFPIPTEEAWVTTINVANIETTNKAVNKIPDDCTVWLNIRFIPEDASTILDRITSLVPNTWEIETQMNEPSLQTEPTHPYIQTIQTVAKSVCNQDIPIYGAHGTSDARHYATVNTPGIEFGPKGANIGAEDEWVDITSLETYSTILKTFLLGLHVNS